MSICLNMIVKNEAHVLESTFTNILKYIKLDYYVICDTGSTDDTISIIKTFFGKRNIPGEVFNHVWKDFGHNRTLALECAYQKTDYLLIFDADDSIVGDFKLPKKLGIDKYQLIFGPTVFYTRPLLVNNRKEWKFEGVLHEYLTNKTPGKTTDSILQGNYYVNSGREGARSKNKNKYFDDAKILAAAFIKEKDPGLKNRYAFYCAQSYKDAGMKQESIDWYTKYLTFTGCWAQEQWVSCSELGKLYLSNGEIKKGMDYFFRSTNYDPERLECIFMCVEILFANKEYHFIDALYHKHKGYSKNLQNKLFINSDLYQNVLEGYYACSLRHINRMPEGLELITKLIGIKCDHKIWSRLIIECNEYLNNMTDDLKSKLFYRISELLETVEYHQDFTEVWTKLFEHERKKLTIYNTIKIAESIKTVNIKPKKNSKKPKKIDIIEEKDNIIITFTTCKRFDLFKQTINSILNTWEDIDKITHWFCVDDNSSESDKDKMKASYPFITYYFKTPAEKGHRQSMNIIFDKLKASDIFYKYWIHMEDDFVFFKKMKYIETAIAGLKENVKQVLFNRNYAETISGYSIKGHLSIPDSKLVQHNYKLGDYGYNNCHYWPHYSFRPSIIMTETILELGDYSSKNTFFERDYADKWAKAGYVSAFFNMITCIHTGRLTSEIGTDKANAYILNDENQFTDKNPCPQKTEPQKTEPQKTESQKIEVIKIIQQPLPNEHHKTEPHKTEHHIKVINLENRKDRKEMMIKKFAAAGITNYEFIRATNLKTDDININFLQELFAGNDFFNRIGVMGCALSHFFLWNKLINDTSSEYYTIFEDDLYLCDKFIDKFDLNKIDLSTVDILFLGWSSIKEKKEESVQCITPLNLTKYIGGLYSYLITKRGATNILNYIKSNGIKHGIDYVLKIANLNYLTYDPVLTTTDYIYGKCIDSDIQNSFERIEFPPKIKQNYSFRFYPKLDIVDKDLYQKHELIGNLHGLILQATNDDKCAGFNTLGFFKSRINIKKLKPSPYFKDSQDGIYVKIIEE